MRATVNGKEVFLKDGELPAVTLSINSLTDPSKIAGTKSTTINILATVEANRALGTEYMGQSKVVEKPILRIGDGGVDHFKSPVVIVQQDRNEIQCIAVAGNATWFAYANGVKLREFDFGLSERITETVQRATWTSLSSILYFPLIDYGSFGGRDDTYSVGYQSVRPGIRISETLRQVFDGAGYVLRPMGALSGEWHKYVMPCATEKTRSIDGDRWPVGVGDGVSDSYVLSPEGTAPTTIHNLGDPPGSGYDGFTDTLVVDEDGYFRVYLYVKFGYDSTEAVTLDGKRIRVVIWDHTDGRELWGEWSQPIFTDPAGGFIEFGQAGESLAIGPAFGMDGHSIALGFQVEGTTGYTLDLPVGNFTYRKEAPYELAENSQFVIQSAMPPWTAMQLLLAWLNHFNLVVSTKGKVVEIWYEEDYMDIPGTGAYRDWTGRMDLTVDPIKGRQENPILYSFRFQEDKSDRYLQQLDRIIGEPGYGNADYDMDGYTPSYTLTLPWAATDMRKTFGGCYIPRMVDEDAEAIVDALGAFEDKYERTPRILIADGIASGTWMEGVTDRTEYPNCYFEGLSANDLPVAFGNATLHGGDPSNTILLRRWKRRLERSRYGRTLEADFFIRDSEIRNFDHGLPTLVNDGSGARWYYVQEITQHKFDRAEPTRCTLVQIPGKALSLRPGADVSYPVPPVPVCGIPDLSYEFIDNEDGTFNLEITMASSADFTPGDVYVEYDGTTPMGGDWSDDWSDDFNT